MSDEKKTEDKKSDGGRAAKNAAITMEMIDRRVAEAVKAEREACAALVEGWTPGNRLSLYGTDYRLTRKAIAGDIRKRGGKA